uniref:Uncharacterized protein n=1 Tax=Panagrolaimus superbus TaxID=310955 RepID=A0A914XUK3_9BILA
MGANQSLGTNNSEFVDSLVDISSIETPEVEFVFRLIDREKFFPPSGKSDAYKEGAWKGTDSNEPPIHISAPGIYTNIMENFDLKKRMSFLNIGSGSGYLSSMVGFVIGSLGVNHGIEVNADIIKFANETKERFINDAVISGFDWCPPEYYCGNAFNIKTDMKYDRIYCGARVPDGERLRFLKLLKIDGVCIMPYGGVFQRIRRASEKTFLCREISNVEFGDMIRPTTSEEIKEIEYVELPFATFPRSLFDITRASIRQNVRDVVGKQKKIFVNQKTSLPSTGYPRDASEDEMLIDHPQPPRLDESGDENIDHRVAPETNSEGYIIHSLQRHARVHIQINAIIDDDPFEAIQGHFETDSDSDNDDNNHNAEQENADNEEIDIRDGVPAQNIDDIMINAVAEGLIGNDEASAENDNEAQPAPAPFVNRRDFITVQMENRARARIRERFEDLIQARFGADGDIVERRPRGGRLNFIQITPRRNQSLPHQNQRGDDTSSSSSPSGIGRKRRAESSDSEDKRVKIEEKFFDPPTIFRQPYVRVAVLKDDIPDRERAQYDERLSICLTEFDEEFRSILSTFPIPRKLLCQLLFTYFEPNLTI